MVSIVRLSAALGCARCELLCPRLSTVRFRETQRFPERCGLLNESLSKVLYICGLELKDWPRGSPTPVLRGGKRGAWSCSLPFPFQDKCASPTLLPHLTQTIICNTIPPIYEHFRYKSVSAFWYESITGRRVKKSVLGWAECYRYVLLPELALAHKELVYIYMAL